MREYRQDRLGGPAPRLRHAEPRSQGAIALLTSKWRFAVPALLVLAALGMTSLPQSPSGATNGVAGSPAATKADVAAPSSGSKAASASATATALASPTRPAPTPTPFRQPAIATAAPAPVGAQAPVRKAGSQDPDPYTDHFILMDGATGAVLFEKNPNQPVAPASLTKIMTTILGIEYGKLDDRPSIDVDARKMVDSTLMGLEPGFDVSVLDLLYGVMLPSGNDAAIAVGRYVAGTDDAFVRMMNQKAAWLGLKNTQFKNPHGLDAVGHYSSPYDMVVMARYAMQYPLFREISAARKWDIQGTNINYTIPNVNPILTAFPGADGIKTGFTDEAGRCLVGSAVRDGHRVYVAFMKSTAGAGPDGVYLMDWAFHSFDWP